MSGADRGSFRLSAPKRALLGALLRREGVVSADEDAIVRDTSGLPAPLSFAQERLWFLEQLEPGTSVYNVFGAVRLEGALDRAALGSAFQEIVRRHDVLRTTISSVRGTPLQSVDASVDAMTRLVDLRERAAATREDEVARLAAEEARRPFDLERGPLFRTTLLCLAEDEHVLFVAMHHIVSDDASVRIFVEETLALYEAYRRGEPPALPEIPIQYADYARWQRRRAASFDADIEYWTAKLRGLPPELPLPFDRPRSPDAVPAHRGAHLRFALPRDLSRAIHEQSRREGVTPFIWFLAAFQTLLHRCGGVDDVPVGAPVSNRSRREIEGLVGLFVDTVVLRADLSGRPSFREVVARAREVALGAFAHQGASFDRVVDALRPPRRRGIHPLFQVMFTLEGPARGRDLSAVDGVRVTPLEVESGTARFDLAMIVGEESGAFAGTVEYDVDLFDRATIERWIAGFEALLARVVAEPDRDVDDIPLPHLPRARRTPGADEASSSPNDGAEADASPRGDVEAKVARIWSSVLGVDRVPRGRSFFDLGGHSLLAVRVMALVLDELGVEIPLRALFDQPTVAGLARAIEAAGAAPRSRIAPAPGTNGERPTSFPLSFAQQRLWFLSRLEGESAAYNLAVAVRLRGVLDVAALERAIREIVRRHEALRTTIVDEGDSPAQRVHATLDVPLAFVDLSSLPASEREARALAFAAADARRAFDLEKGPLVQTTLLRLDERDHALLYVMHHIVSDGASMGVLVRELGALYEAFRARRPSPLADLPIQFADFALWQRAGGEVMSRQLAYWTDRLAGARAFLDLPSDRRRPAVSTFRGVGTSVTMSREVLDSLRSLGRSEHATLYMTLAAAWKVLLSRLSGQSDVVVGAPIANRSRVEVEGLIGFFVNTLALRTDLSDRPRFRDLVRRERETVLDAFAHADVPFERIVEELRPQRLLGRTPIFQVFFNWLDGAPPPLQLPGLDVESLDDGTVADSKFDLTLYASAADDGLLFRLVGSADLFDEPRLVVMLAQLGNLLEQIVREPDETIDRFSLVTPDARATLPDPARPLDRDEAPGVVRRFVENARRAPEREAVRDANGSWTYGELRERSAELAAWLRDRGIAREDVVAIFAQRSAALVAAILGAFEARAAVLVLDPAHPAARLAECIRLARPRAALEIADAGAVPPALVAALDSVDCRVRRAFELHRARPDGLAGDGLVGIEPDDLATIVFTSGTSGRPKGILGTHRPLDRFVAWHVRTFELGEADRFALLSGLSHDPLFRDVLTPLSLGATLCVPEPDVVSSPRRLAEWMRRERVSVAHLTPGFARALAGGVEDAAATLPALRFAFFGGDALERGVIDRLREFAPGATCVNFYGATETPQAVAFHLVGDADRARVPIGRGIEGVDLVVLGESGNLCGIGELGEIHVRTAGLARGYLDDDTLTRERFVPNPFTNAPGDRLYRTGDLGRYLPNGEVDFVGRRDRQVKVRGHRVELGEIEAALLAVDSVRDSLVVAREGREGDVDLVAYVVARPREAPPTLALRDELRRRLPQPMIPASFVFLDAIPLTPNGKPDLRALPPADDEATPRDDGERATRDPIAEIVAGMFAEVLGRDRVGVHDDFFDLGGHSLLAMKVLSRAGRAFGVDLPLRAIFEARTVERLAARITEATRDGKSADDRPIRRIPSGAAHPLSFAQQRLWFLDRLDPDSAAYNVVSALKLIGPLDVATLRHALDEIVRRHETLRTTLGERDGMPVSFTSSSQSAALEVIDLRTLPRDVAEREARRRASEDAQLPFDLQRGPLWRATLLRLTDEEHALVVTMHHAITDAESMAIFFREMGTLYSAFVAGRPSPLPEPPIQYSDFAAWQRDALVEVRAAQLAYWRERLRDAPPVLELPSERARPPKRDGYGATARTTFDASLADRVRRLARREGATLFMTLLAAFQAFLHRITGQVDVVVGTPIANRRRDEVEGLLGFFANTLAIRVDLADDPTFVDLLARVREATLGAHAHADLPFEQLVEDLHPTRSRSHHPLVQVMFVLNEAAEREVEVPPLRVASLEGPDDEPIDRGTARFDWTLAMTDAGEGLVAALEYATDLFDRATIERMLASFERLLEGIAADPDARVSRLPILTDAERTKLLVEWNDGSRRLPADSSLQTLFEGQVDRTPDAAALAFGDTTLTYREIDRRANRLAHRLRALGVVPEARVAILMERSAEMVIALLATVKAGGAYVPLDPAYPSERLAFLLEDSGATVLVTDSRLAASLRNPCTAVVLIDVDRDAIERESDARPRGGAASPNLAYVIYTSGSTGKPKGVLVTQANVIRLFEATRVEMGFESSDVWTLFHSIAFDFSVWEMWGALLHGGRVVVVPQAVSRSPEEFFELVRRERVTVLSQTPSAFRELMAVEEAAGEGVDLALRLVIFGGEPLELRSLRPWWARHREGRPRLVNLYGITETTVHVTRRRLVAADSETPHGSVIGRPLADLRVYVLDARGEPAPIGVAGEIFVGGAGVARGYLGRPDLTAERFVPDPFAREPGARLYRTGDLARFRADGEIEYLGRIDHQVKIRGFRVELGEIEATLAEHEAVREAVVVAREERGDKRLVAYVVQRGDAPVDALRAFVQSRLPDYMVPSRFVKLDALPLTPNGKIDRRLLPAPDASRSIEAKRFTPPRDDVEAAVAQAFQEVLGVSPIGATDDFFELGGHSMLALRVMTAIRSRVGKNLPLVAIFEDPTVERLAARLRGAERRADTSPLVRLRASGSRAPLFLVHAAGGTVFGYRRLVERLDDRPVFGLQSAGLEGEREPITSLEEMARRYVAAVLEMRRDGPIHLAGWSLGGVIAFEMARQLVAADREVGVVALFDTTAPGRSRWSDPSALESIAIPDDLPPDVPAADRERMLRVLRANLQAAYGSPARAGCIPIVLFRASEPAAGDARESDRDPTLGWSALTTERIDVQFVPGTHDGLLEPPHVSALADQLARRLDEAPHWR